MDDPFSIHILSLDGGGIYGLTQALWLRKLCEQCDNFLDGTDVDMFAGCSSGAINALLLARYERPREAVLGGVLEAFWMDAGTFTNTDPMGAWLSLYGLTPLFSEKDFLSQLERHFGNDTLREVKQNVLVSAYNWTGGSASFREAGQQLPWPYSIATPTVQSGGMPGGEGWGPMYFQNYKGDTRILQEMRRWLKPEDLSFWDEHKQETVQLLKDFEEDPCLDYRVADVAYGAATPPGFRKIRGGIGDGASFTANPAVAAIADSQWIMNSRIQGRALLLLTKANFSARQGAIDDLLDKWNEIDRSIDKQGELLKYISVMSIGSGQYMPAYWLRDIDLGLLSFQLMPTNPGLGVWYPPQAYSLDPAVKGDEYVCWSLLNDRFYRLNPSILSLPTATAAYAARFPLLKEWLVSQIQAAVNSAASLHALDDALEFLSKGWMSASYSDEGLRRKKHPANEIARTKEQLASARNEIAEKMKSAQDMKKQLDTVQKDFRENLLTLFKDKDLLQALEKAIKEQGVEAFMAKFAKQPEAKQDPEASESKSDEKYQKKG